MADTPHRDRVFQFLLEADLSTITMDDVAREFLMCRATLCSRLASEGYSYRRIHDEVRRHRIKAVIEHYTRDLKRWPSGHELVEKLNYSSPKGVYNAFPRLMGCSYEQHKRDWQLGRTA